MRPSIVVVYRARVTDSASVTAVPTSIQEEQRRGSQTGPWEEEQQQGSMHEEEERCSFGTTLMRESGGADGMV